MAIDEKLFQKFEQILNGFDCTIANVVDNQLFVTTKNSRYGVQVKIPATMDAVHRFCNGFFFENRYTDPTVFPKCVKRRGRATIVEWGDGTQTKIIRAADEEETGLYAAFCIALAKKLYGSNSALKKAIHFADEERQLAAEQEIVEMKKQAHEERMRKQLDRSTKRIARLARRAFKRDVIAHLATENIQVEDEVEENEPC